MSILTPELYEEIITSTEGLPLENIETIDLHFELPYINEEIIYLKSFEEATEMDTRYDLEYLRTFYPRYEDLLALMRNMDAISQNRCFYANRETLTLKYKTPRFEIYYMPREIPYYKTYIVLDNENMLIEELNEDELEEFIDKME